MKSTRSIPVARSVLGFTLAIFVITGSLRAQYAEDALRFSTFNLGIGARSAGMGNASIGLADDYSALFTNPAGLASLRSFEFSVGFSNFGYSNDAKFLGNTLNATDRATNLNNLGLVYPVPTTRGSLTFAFGFARVANYGTVASLKGFNANSSIVNRLTRDENVGLDLSAMTPSDREEFLDNNSLFQSYLVDIDSFGRKFVPSVTDSVQQEATIRERGGVNSWSFGGSIDLAKNLSVGFGINILSGSYGYDRLYVESDAENVYKNNLKRADFQRFQYESSVSSDLSGYGASIGVMYRKQGRFKLGLAVRTPIYYEVSENFSRSGHSWFYNEIDGRKDYDLDLGVGSTKYKVKTPVVLSGGISFQVADWLLLAGDAEMTDWTEMEFSDGSPDLVEENRIIRDLFRQTTNLRGGAEFSLLDLGVKLRGGVVYRPSPYRDDPSEFDELYLTGGFGLSIEENVFLNGSAALGKWKTLRDNYVIPDLAAPPSRTSESISTNVFNVTLSFRF